ncbi:glucosylglycerol-phosphate synthase [Candidatus Thalassolituus haligoni]|jgi:glucosylglycerol-phosphate synthase|uniref:glucosylglycerol-phosphate synthase n=1 Tax=Candidatus Thalassolituus haligoni TaxID=3100113 RepID=UPI0035110953|tara:strand:- start:1924 stop:4194 length:2271 start_codon:yes stop_codon:yes gene_type:complete
MLLATDLDGTFLSGNPDDRQQLYHLINHHPDIRLAFVTGRGIEMVMPLLSDPSIPQPDYIICDVGATIVDGETLQPITHIQGEIEQNWPGELAVTNALAAFTELQRQDVPQERRCSYYCEQGSVSAALQTAVSQLGCDLLYSSDQYLDVLPRGVNKGSTLDSLAEWLGLSQDQVLIAGDSLNDLAMISLDYPSVCVGGSESRLLEATERSTMVYHAEKNGCGGILEAFNYFGFLGEAGVEAEARAEQQTGKSDLVVVYHRLPFEEKVENGVMVERQPSSPNGIIPTLLSFFGDGKPGSWVAWSTVDPATPGYRTRSAVDIVKYPKLVAARVALTTHQVDIFYKKFSKEAFWPTLHTFWERATFLEEDWLVYLEVNRLFAERAAAEAAENAVVWIHDYNLWMVPAFLRELRPDVTIAFFHHTYFPSADVFNVVPWRREIIGSLLQCDFIGFHIPRQSENFVDVARGVTPIKVLEKQNCAPRFMTYGCAVGLEEMTSVIKVHGRIIHLGAHPVGLDLSRISHALDKPEIQAQIRQLKKELEGTRVLLSVERLDYTKGILEKLHAFERLLDEHPELIGNVTLVTICVPAAAEMTVYAELQVDIEQAVGRINGRFAQIGWTPLQFFFRKVPFEQLVAYYAMADVMWITPLRDGLNLVAKEYVATQGMVDGAGVLVLSEFAGAAAELRGALLTNPHSPHELADSAWQGLIMDEAEARSRIRDAFDVVQHHDIERWGHDFLDAVEVARLANIQQVAEDSQPA